MYLHHFYFFFKEDEAQFYNTVHIHAHIAALHSWNLRMDIQDSTDFQQIIRRTKNIRMYVGDTLVYSGATWHTVD